VFWNGWWPPLTEGGPGQQCLQRRCQAARVKAGGLLSGGCPAHTDRRIAERIAESSAAQQMLVLLTGMC
jgi:hypothetical protein